MTTVTTCRVVDNDLIRIDRIGDVHHIMLNKTMRTVRVRALRGSDMVASILLGPGEQYSLPIHPGDAGVHLMFSAAFEAETQHPPLERNANICELALALEHTDHRDLAFQAMQDMDAALAEIETLRKELTEIKTAVSPNDKGGILSGQEIMYALGPIINRFRDDGWGHLATTMQVEQCVEFARAIEGALLRRDAAAAPIFLAEWTTCPKCNGDTYTELNLRGPNYEPMKFQCDKCVERPGFVAVPKGVE